MTATVTFTEARSAGLTRYFSGRPCVNGHIADRLVSNGTCVICSNDRLKRWSDKNKDRLTANHRRHVERDPISYAQKARARYEAKREYRLAQTAKWHASNKEKSRAIKAAWKKRNRPYGAADANKRRAMKLDATPRWADHDAILAIYAECARITRETGIRHHVDHIIPLRGKNVRGLHVHYNLQVLEARQNISKGCRLLEPTTSPSYEGK